MNKHLKISSSILIKPLIFLLGVLSFSFSGEPISSNESFLFCLKKEINPLRIDRSGKTARVDIKELNDFMIREGVINVEPWISGVKDTDRDGDIYLNRIYRIITTSDAKKILINIKNDLEKLNEIHSVEFEYKRKPLYTPNDQYYNNQWFLPDINSNDAWDFWNIDNGETPGNRDVILASVDLGVFYQHPDLRDNIWNNLGEDIDGDGQTIIESGGSWIFDPDDINLIDDDGNGYIDDFIGWDCSGVSGGEDNNPMPPSGVSNGGTWAHGTHVAGLLSATTDNNTGIASASYNCSIMCVKVSTGEQDYPYITHGYNGILYASQAGHDAGNYAMRYQSV